MSAIITSNKPQFIEWYLNGKLSIDTRSRFSLDLLGSTCYLYCSHPISKVVAKATISDIVKLKPIHYSSKIISLLTAKFDGYFFNIHRSSNYLIKLSNIVKLEKPLDISFFGKTVAPPSWAYVNKDFKISP